MPHPQDDRFLQTNVYEKEIEGSVSLLTKRLSLEINVTVGLKQLLAVKRSLSPPIDHPETGHASNKETDHGYKRTHFHLLHLSAFI